VHQLFDEALNQPEAERVPFLQAACAGDPTLLRAVEELLRSRSSPTSFQTGIPSNFSSTRRLPSRFRLRKQRSSKTLLMPGYARFISASPRRATLVLSTSESRKRRFSTRALMGTILASRLMRAGIRWATGASITPIRRPKGLMCNSACKQRVR